MSVKAFLLAFIAIKLSASALSRLWPAHPWLQRLVKSTKSGLKCIIRCSLQPSPPNSTCLINLYIESHQAKAKPSPRRLAWVGRNKAVSYYFQKKQSRAWGRTENKVESEIWKHCTFLSHDKDRLMTSSVTEEASCIGCQDGFPLSVFKLMVILMSEIIAIPGTLPKHFVRSQQNVSFWAHNQKEKKKSMHDWRSVPCSEVSYQHC